MIEVLLSIAVLGLLALAGWNAGRPENDRPKWAPKVATLVVLGWCISFLVGHGFDLLGLAITAAVAAGASFGPGNAIGPAISGEAPNPLKAEWWQKGPLLKSAWLSLAVLGFLWGVSTALVHLWLPLAFVVGLPLAAVIGIALVGGRVNRVDDTSPIFQIETARSNKAWMLYNILRAPISGLLLIGLLLVPSMAKADTDMVVIVFCSVPIYIISISDMNGSRQARVGSYKAIKGNNEAWGLFQQMLADPTLSMRKWRIEEDVGMKCL
jgi:hypothetical protein